MMLTYVLKLSYAGGGTYCAIASLRLMGFIGVDLLSNGSGSSIIDPSLLLNWSLQVLLPDNITFKFRNEPKRSDGFSFLVYRDKPMMVGFKVGLTNRATHATHFGKSPLIYLLSRALIVPVR